MPAPAGKGTGYILIHVYMYSCPGRPGKGDRTTCCCSAVAGQVPAREGGGDVLSDAARPTRLPWVSLSANATEATPILCGREAFEEWYGRVLVGV